MIEKQAALVVFLDIKGAFDNLHCKVIAHGMRKHDVDKDIVLGLQNYLDCRYCRIKGSTQHFRLIQGTGQGGILSPTIWNFVMDSFLELLKAHTADVIGYADDGAIISIANNIYIAQQVMQTALDKAQAWADTDV
jgi:retron-type reverse transcriptase